MAGTAELAGPKTGGGCERFLRSLELMRTRSPITPFYFFVFYRNSNVFINAGEMCAQKFPGSGIFYRQYIVPCRAWH
jgi:hypothetical protein